MRKRPVNTSTSASTARVPFGPELQGQKAYPKYSGQLQLQDEWC